MGKRTLEGVGRERGTRKAEKIWLEGGLPVTEARGKTEATCQPACGEAWQGAGGQHEVLCDNIKHLVDSSTVREGAAIGAVRRINCLQKLWVQDDP